MDSNKPFAKIFFCIFIFLALPPASGSLAWAQGPLTSAMKAISPATAPPSPEQKTEKPAEPQAQEEEEIYPQKVHLKSPAAVLDYFRKAMARRDYEKASKCFQLSKQQLKMSDAELSELAWKLGESLNRIDEPGMWKASKAQDADEAHLILTGDPDEVVVVDQNDKGDWGFTYETVAIINDLYDRVGDRDVIEGRDWLMDLFPQVLQGRAFLLPYYQWICLLIVILVGILVDLAVRQVLNQITFVIFKLRKVDIRSKVQPGIWRPVGLFIRALIWYEGTVLIGIRPDILKILLIGLHLFAVVAALWTMFVVIDLFATYLKAKAKRTETKFDDLLILLISRTLKIFAVCMGFLFFADSFHLSVIGLLGGMGIGGLIIAFAAKDTLSNIFGSLTFLVDRPFEIGDWIVTEKVEGRVESVGIRTTRVRTFYNSLVTLPNSHLTTASIDNMGRRRYRRYKTTLNIQYSTRPDQVEAFCEGIRELIRRQPYTRKSLYHVYLTKLGETSLEILLYFFMECPNWAVELRERQSLLLDIMRLAEELNVKFAFPTQTLHLNEFEPPRPHIELGDDPVRSGRERAARLSGPVLSAEERPGKVQYPEPLDLNVLDAKQQEENGEPPEPPVGQGLP